MSKVIVKKALKFLAENVLGGALQAAGQKIGEAVGERVGARMKKPEPEETKAEAGEEKRDGQG